VRKTAVKLQKRELEGVSCKSRLKEKGTIGLGYILLDSGEATEERGFDVYDGSVKGVRIRGVVWSSGKLFRAWKKWGGGGEGKGWGGL